jgi:hypothetical protein
LYSLRKNSQKNINVKKTRENLDKKRPAEKSAGLTTQKSNVQGKTKNI